MNRNSYEMRLLLSIGLELGIPGVQFIGANYPHSKPDYPYGEINIITPMNDQAGYSIVEDRDGVSDTVIQTYSQTPEMTISVNAYSLSEQEASDLAYKMRDWFDVGSDLYLGDRYIAVIDVMSMQDRTVVIQDGFERRFGFDVRLRYTRDVERTVESINTVDTIRRDDNV